MPVAVFVLIFVFDWRLSLCCLFPLAISVFFLICFRVCIKMSYPSDRLSGCIKGYVYPADPCCMYDHSGSERSGSLSGCHFGFPVLQSVFLIPFRSSGVRSCRLRSCAKSTVANLAAGFYDVNGGKITLGGTDIAPVDSVAMMKDFSVVFQNVVLFNNTVMENIRIGRKDATDEDVIAAAKAARCHAFIEKLPDGYQTVIGENGSTLSGGECQRLSIARALLKDAPVILLDEATASLDVDNETEIQKAISKLVIRKTGSFRGISKMPVFFMGIEGSAIHYFMLYCVRKVF